MGIETHGVATQRVAHQNVRWLNIGLVHQGFKFLHHLAAIAWVGAVGTPAVTGPVVNTHIGQLSDFIN